MERPKIETKEKIKEVVVGIIYRIRKEGEREYLLVSSKKDFGEFTGFYYPPGGHLEEGENFTDCLIREMKEELDLIVEPIEEVSMSSGDVKNQNTHWWLCNVLGGELKIKEDEVADASYFTKEEMDKLNIWPATRMFFDEHIF